MRSEGRKALRLRANFDIHLSADASILEHNGGDTDREPHLNISGYTANVGEGGLALILPSFPLDEGFCQDEKMRVRIGLHLPEGPVALHAAPVHCEPLDGSDPGQGYLLGVRIMQMDAPDQERYRKYLNAAPGV